MAARNIAASGLTMARPTKFTPETKKRLIDSLRAGLTRSAACGAAGINFQTFLTWCERGKAAKSGEFFEFFESLSNAENEAASRMESLFITAAKEEPKYALEWLKRRRRLEWGDNIAITADREFAATLAALEAGAENGISTED